MKKTLLITLCIVALFAACSDDEKASLDLNVIPDIIQFGDTESVQKVYVSSNTSWVTSSNQEWCVPATLQKFGNDSVEIKVFANETYDNRIAYITITNADQNIIKTVKVLQKSVGGNFLRNADSLVLVKLYDALNGDEWTNNTGWKTSAMENWHGVVINNNRVTAIKMENNNLVGEIIPEIGELTMLDTLALVTEIGVDGSLPVELVALSNLKYINITGTSMHAIIEVASSVTNLQELILSSNLNLTDNLAGIGGLANLKSLVLNNMPIGGFIPTEFANIAKLERLELTSCDIEGAIPAEIFTITSLKHLSFDKNSLYGVISGDFENLVNLETLILSNNAFSGTISNKMLNLENLSILKVENNHLSGAVPLDLFTNTDSFTLCPQKGTSFTNYSCD